jgi:hypothetical protein
MNLEFESSGFENAAAELRRTGVFMEEVLIKPKQNAVLQMRRKLGPFEHLLWLVDKWTIRNFVFVARIEGGSISVESLKTALFQAQRRHPILRAAIHVNGDGDPEFLPSSMPILVRVVRRANNTQWLHEAETQLAIPFEPNNRPRLRVVLVQGDAVSELILVVHHSIGDGVSAMHLVRDLLKSIEGYELKELPPRPALEDLVCSGATAPMNQLRRPNMGSNGVARFDRPQRASPQIFQIEPDELDRVLLRCRQEGTTFNGALLSALLLSLPGRETLQCLAPINARKLFPNMIEDFGLYISSGMATLDRNTTRDFWSLARSARRQVMQAFNLNALQTKAVAMASIVATRPNPQTTYERVWRNLGYNAVLTNHGKFPNMSELTHFRVTAAYPILSPELEPVVAIATADQRAYITVSSPPELVGHSSKFLDLLRQQCGLRQKVGNILGNNL